MVGSRRPVPFVGRTVKVPSIRPGAREERPDGRRETRDDERRAIGWGPGGPWFVGISVVAIFGLALSFILGISIPRDLSTAFVVAIGATILFFIWRTYRRDGLTRTVVASIIHLAAFLLLIASFHVGPGPAKDILWAIAFIGFAIGWVVVRRG